MAGSSIKIGADVTEFKRGMTEAQASVKALDATIKTNEKTMQLYGKSESYVSTQAGLLNQKLEEQKKIAQNAEKSLKAMEENGVSKTSKAYQDMQRRMMEARGAMIDTEVALNQLTTGEAEAAKGADQLANSIGGISKKMSLDQVIGGISSITSGLERAAQKAVQLGDTIWNSVMERAKWADDTATQALMYGIDLDTYLRMQKLVQNGLDTTVDAILNAQSRLNRGVGSGSSAVMDELSKLGLVLTGKYGEQSLVTNDSLELFWKAGRALMDLGDAFDKEAAAQTLFGRSWKELVPLFDPENGGYETLEDYQKALSEVNVNSEEDVKVLAELNDKIGELKGNLETLSTDILAQLAPALKDGAEALNGVLKSILDYLEKPEGQEALRQLGDAISGLFGDLSKIEPEKVVGGFVEAFTKVTGGIQWLVDNKETAKGILGAIVGGWATLKLAGGALDVLKLVQGLQGLSGGVSLSGISGVGASLGSAFASSLAAVLPGILVGVLTTPTIEKLLRGETPEEKENRENIEAISDAGKEAAKAGITVPTLQEMISFVQTGELPESYVQRAEEEAKEVTYVGLDGHIYNEEGENVGYMMPKGEGLIHKSRRPSDYGTALSEELSEEIGDVPITIDPVVPDGAAQDIEMDIGKITVPVGLVVEDLSDDAVAALFGGQGKANGMWAVPYDGYLARLHKNERVVPAREVASRSYSSNLYVEQMIMNNGTDADGLAAAMAAKQRQTMTGFGS